MSRHAESRGHPPPERHYRSPESRVAAPPSRWPPARCLFSDPAQKICLFEDFFNHFLINLFSNEISFRIQLYSRESPLLGSSPLHLHLGTILGTTLPMNPLLQCEGLSSIALVPP
jgi:hypothetical protein